MKFKNYIETESGIKDTSTSPGTAGQLLSSTVAGTSWIDQNTISSGTSEVIDIQVKNISSADGGVNLSKGDPVYIYGSVGSSARLYVDLADADSTATNNLGDSKMPCVALLDQDLSPNGEGTATVVGKLRNLITNPIDGDVPNENDTVYVKSGGGLTLTKPTGSTNLIQNVGQVGRVSTSNDGNIVVAALLRSNDVPNLPEGRIWVGDSNTIVSDTVYLDETNERMGIGTIIPSQELHVDGNARLTGLFYDGSNSGGTSGQILSSDGGQTEWIDGSAIPGVPAGSGTINYLARWTPDNDTLGIGVTYDNGTNVGIGTNIPNSKLQVDGEIDANGDDGYRINGKPWAAESSNNLRLGDWDGEGFTTTIYDDTSAPVVIVKQSNVGIGTTTPGYNLDVSGDAYIDETLNIESTISGTPFRGYPAVGAGNLVVGGMNFASWSPGVITLINQDTTISAGQDLGVLQFVGKDDQTNGYASSMIKGLTAFTGGSGNSGGGILSFLTCTGYSGPSERMRIIQNGDVGIGATSPSEKLEVNGSVKATASTDAYKGYIKQTIFAGANEKSTTSNYNLIPYSTLTTTTSNQSYNRMVAAYDGRIKKVYIKNTGGNTPNATAVNFKKQTNNVTSSTVYSATVTGSGANMSAYYDFANNDFTFNAGDSFGILYQTTDSGNGARTMGGVAINIIIEYNIT